MKVAEFGFFPHELSNKMKELNFKPHVRRSVVGEYKKLFKNIVGETISKIHGSDWNDPGFPHKYNGFLRFCIKNHIVFNKKQPLHLQMPSSSLVVSPNVYELTPK